MKKLPIWFLALALNVKRTDIDEKENNKEDNKEE